MYRLTDNADLVVRIVDGFAIPRGHRWWGDFESWVADGNTPLPATTKMPTAIDSAVAQVNAWRTRQENTEVTFHHAGHVWDAGLRSKARIEPLLELDDLPAGFFWTDHDNNDVPVTMDELRAIGAAMNLTIVDRGFAIHQRQREMKQQLESMSAEELLAFEPGWPE